MRGKSHHQLGLYLAKHFLAGSPKWYVTAFLLGCTQPDLVGVMHIRKDK